jgi:hypothetical protein
MAAKAKITSRLMAALAVLWASPASMLGLAAGLAGLATGGGGRRCGRVLEFWGGAVAWLLRHGPFLRGALAVTFGHVVLGQTVGELNRCRDHELVHVRQYERWGPLFLPAYVGCSLVLSLCGRDRYLDNPFEVEAFRQAP